MIYHDLLVTGRYLSRRPFVHVISNIAIDLFIVSDYWQMCLVSTDTMMLKMECQKDCLID